MTFEPPTPPRPTPPPPPQMYQVVHRPATPAKNARWDWLGATRSDRVTRLMMLLAILAACALWVAVK